jgi:3-hydroxyacyl-CoA dehydrogenase/enoyl-CoA hydratase/3-hydroxybutyryl-CoA epimerase
MSIVGRAFRLEMDDGVAIVTFDLPGESVNKFSNAVIAEFDGVMNTLDRDLAVRAVVIMSGKPDSYIAGADIDEFLTFTTAAMATSASAEGQKRFERIERFRVPIVAAIHGACMGGGLEMALACKYRIATDHPKTVLALPETQLGLIPGLGGTQRLPKVVGLQMALDMILTGKNIRAKKALQSGLVDEMVHPSILRQVAVQRARLLGGGSATSGAQATVQLPTPRPRLGRAPGPTGWFLDGTPVGRAIVLSQARKMTASKTRGNYPALPAAIDVIAKGFSRPGEAYTIESQVFGEMAMTPVSKQLISIFFATTALKKDTGVAGGGPAPLPVSRIAVLGTGFMGAGIAAISAQNNIAVRFKDVAHDAVARGLAAVRDVLKERLKRKQVTKQQYDDQLSLVAGTTLYEGFAGVPLVIEAVFEDLAVKHKVLRDVEPMLKGDAIFASNTSTIPISKIAESAQRPDRVVGMHFFSPVHKMPLLEVIVTPRTAPEVVTTAVAFGRTLGKTVIVVNDSPGFFVNRILGPYLNEAGRMIDEGFDIDAIDQAMVDWGFPVGPLTLLDEVGLDIAAKSGPILAAAFGERLKSPASLDKVIASGRLGRKNRKGFYLYDEKGKKGGVDSSVYALLPDRKPNPMAKAEEIQQRLSLAMLNEAARCLDEGVIRQARDGDIGAIFGIGFPPFRGGPFRCIDSIGVANVVRQLELLDHQHPGRFGASRLLRQLASSGKSIY